MRTKLSIFSVLLLAALIVGNWQKRFPREPKFEGNAVAAINAINSEPEWVIPAMIPALHDPDLSVRWNAAITLGNFGSRARAAVPDLREASADSAIKEQVDIALRRIGPESANAE